MRLQRGAQALARARRRDIVTPSSPSPKRPKVAGSGMSRFENCAFISDMPSVMALHPEVHGVDAFHEARDGAPLADR